MKPSDVTAAEYGAWYKNYIEISPDKEITTSLLETFGKTVSFFKSIPEDKLAYRYEAGKWTPKEILQHLMDTERIFAYRALRIARNDSTPIPGFEQDDYVVPSKANERSMDDLLEEYKSVRLSSIGLFKSFDEEMWQRVGTASNNPFSARAAAAIIPGHELHHMSVIKDKYL